MRGVDYRAAKGTQGISLLIMGTFTSTRAYVQGLGRVGRYNENCLRFLWKHLKTPVDDVSQDKIVGQLKALTKANTFRKMQPQPHDQLKMPSGTDNK